MGNIASRAEDGSSLSLRDQSRLSITSVKITTARNRIIYIITPNAYPATRFSVTRGPDDEAPVEYIQDPEQANGPPSFLLRISSQDDVYFYFTFAIRQSKPSTEEPPIDTVINSLTFLFAPTQRELEALTTREFNADPNIHRNPNVDLVGDYTTAGRPTEQFEWSWKWRPPKLDKDKGGGWRNSCSFVEYDQRAHKLSTLLSFSFWINGTRSMGSPRASTRMLEPPTGTRIRVPSAQSMDSRLSDSDTEANLYPASPNIEPTIPEDGLELENETSCNPIKIDLNFQRPGEDVSAVDDGPIFRATMKALEQKTGNMRTRMKHVIKRAEAAKESQVQSNRSISAFMESLRGASSSNANAVQPALDHYFEKIATEILAYEQRNAENLQRLIIDPLTRFYSNEIKQADSKKKDFEDESKDYYNYVSKYLGQRQDSLKDKKRADSDSKYQAKRRNFELKRFDYSSFMQDLHGGRKDQELLAQLTRYADAQAKGYLATAKKVEAMMPQLEALISEVREADKEYQLIRTGREEKRRTLEKGPKTMDFDLSDQPQSSGVPSSHKTEESSIISSATSGPPTERRHSGTPLGAALALQTTVDGSLSVPPKSLVSVSPGNKFKGYRDLEDIDSTSSSGTSQRREGLLWSLSRAGGHYVDPKALNKQAWHKYWIVLDQGRLSEYVNWKDVLEQHRDPIDLRVASVREARNAERRFCFEIITPTSTRVYQAPSEEEMKAWIQAINNALQSAFESKTPMPEQRSTKSSSSMARDLFGKSSSFHGHRSTSSASVTPSARAVSRHATVSDRPPLRRSRSSEERPAQLLQSIRDADPSNLLCADCGSDSRAEWVSINLGIVVCIECSGIHRSLGTHISKIRSLTLDTVSFTQDIVELLLRVGNNISNGIWEATLDRNSDFKPKPNSSREQRLRFITAKYAQKTFVAPVLAAPNDLLLASIKTQNIQNAIHALALSADPNTTDRSRATHVVYLALAAADPASPSQISPTAQKPDPKDTRKSFFLAELLLQNGAEIPASPPPIPLGSSAWLYLEFKKTQRTGRLTTNASVTDAAIPNQTPLPSRPAPVPPTVPNREYPNGDMLAPLPRFDNTTSRLSFGGSPLPSSAQGQ